MITNEWLDKFIKLYEDKYFKKLEKQEALDLFSWIINLVDIAYFTKHINKNE